MKVVQLNMQQSHSILQIDSLTTGVSLVFDIYIKRNNDYVIIIEAGTLLTEELYKKLQNQEALYISNHDEENKELSHATLKSYIIYNKNNLVTALGFICEVNNNMFKSYLESSKNDINVESVRAIVGSIIYLLKQDSKFLKKTLPYFKSEHQLAIHSLHVCVIALNLGVVLKLSSKELIQLGIAALLHDVGLKIVEESIISKESKLTLEELESVQQHPLYSVQIIKHNNIHEPYIIEAITHHHESYDGSGYPEKLGANEISTFASIIAISDVFDALTNNRPHRKAFTSFEALKKMLKADDMVSTFNTKFLQLFLHSIAD